MATDNKINSGNSWTLHLIDYFHDMSLLRNTDDHTINFQRASYTLDGCVKVWTSRVDSVGTETGKLLSNLANDVTDDRDQDSDADNSDNPDGVPGGGGSQHARKRKNRWAGQTIVKDVSQLRSKKLDLEFSVDPLFKKTSADFDEGGAGGLLMNHLSLGFGTDSALRVVFDASDSKGKVEEEYVLEEAEESIDISELRSMYLPDLTVLEHKEIVPSLSDFSFSNNGTAARDKSTFFPTATFDDDDDEDFGGPSAGGMDDRTQDAGGDPMLPAEEDFFAGAQANHAQDDYDYGGGPGSDHGDDDDPPPDGPDGGYGAPDNQNRRGAENQEHGLNHAADSTMLNFFESTLVTNWAGPNYWKQKRTVPTRQAEAGPSKPKKAKKEAFKIDFSPDERSLAEITKELFAPGKASINMKQKDFDDRDEYRLPDDMHFTSRQLVTLFLKPKFQLKMKGRDVRYNDNGDGEVDTEFWAQAAADQAAGQKNPDEEDGPAVLFNTQFFQDDDDDGFGGFDDLGEMPAGGGSTGAQEDEEDLLASTQGTRRVKPEAVNYTKRAKRVDVRRLKETIWSTLDIPDPKPGKGKGKSKTSAARSDEDEEMRGLSDEEEEPKVFQNVLEGLQASYPPEKMAEISTSFCFICLLHLANEQGLKLEDDEPGEVEQTGPKVGNIFNLKVSRDLDLGDPVSE